VNPDFLACEEVLDLHAQQLARYGGASGLRDRGLLESAVAQAQASFAGAFVHDSLYAMAAAYLYHIVSNHPFVDGNKRTGLLAALTFLELNGVGVTVDWRLLYELTMAVARGEVDKNHVSDALRELTAQSDALG
jgi:death-on-curing protein